MLNIIILLSGSQSIKTTFIVVYKKLLINESNYKLTKMEKKDRIYIVGKNKPIHHQICRPLNFP